MNPEVDNNMTCENCSTDVTSLVYKGSRAWCWGCHNDEKGLSFGQSSMISTDDIPGGLEIRNGICNDDGSPKRYYSKSEIKRAAFERNLFIVGDTPKPNQRFLEAKQNGIGER